MKLKDFLETPEGKRLSQSQWARAFHLSRGYFNQLISGKKTPSLALALYIDAQTRGMVDIYSWPTTWPPENRTEAPHDAGDS